MLTVVDGYIRNKNISKLMEEEEHICKKIRYSTPKFMLGDAIQSGDIEAVGSSGETFEDVKVKLREEVNRPFPWSPQLEELEMIKVNYNRPHPLPNHCLLSLLHFPENPFIKKMGIILWWMMVGFV